MTISRTVCLGFLTVITIGTILLIMPFSTSNGNWNNPLIALFTSTSAVCVTGLIVVDTGSYFSIWGQIIILLLIQIGGLGYMMMSTFLMLILGRNFDLSQKFAIKESFDRPFAQGSQNLVRSIIATTLVFELTGIILLFLFFSQEQFSPLKSLWLAIFHSISAWNNAGFSLFIDNLVSYQSSLFLNLIITALIIFGGIGYQVIIELYFWLSDKLRGKREKTMFSLNFKVVISTSLILLILGWIAFIITESTNPETLKNMSFSEKLITSWFQSVTTRTAGFNTIDLGKMTTAGLFITIGLMFVGASPSGTGGGIKTTTLRILSQCTRSVLRGQEEVILYKREIPTSLVLKAVAVMFGSVATIILGTTLISFANPELDLIAIFFEVISAFATVGLSTGITAKISSFGQIILVITMFTGRVGVLLLIAGIIGDSKPSVIKYPEENLLVG
jgi:trk system potassium uptake protein TrkH